MIIPAQQEPLPELSCHEPDELRKNTGNVPSSENVEVYQNNNARENKSFAQVEALPAPSINMLPKEIAERAPHAKLRFLAAIRDVRAYLMHSYKVLIHTFK